MMPQKNSIKTYVKDSYYHVYNRGVEKRAIFLDEKDYLVFLSYLKQQLSPPPKTKDILKTVSFKGLSFKGVPRLPKNFGKQIELVAFCLMPNHFHLLIKQNAKNAMEGFIRSLITRYAMYFNERHKRVGGLFQGRYKAAQILDDAHLLHLSRYIHLNPEEDFKNLEEAYSSYAVYLGKHKTPWIKPGIILSFFKKKRLPFLERIQTYRDFVNEYKQDSGQILGKLTLES